MIERYFYIYTVCLKGSLTDITYREVRHNSPDFNKRFLSITSLQIKELKFTEKQDYAHFRFFKFIKIWKPKFLPFSASNNLKKSQNGCYKASLSLLIMVPRAHMRCEKQPQSQIFCNKRSSKLNYTHKPTMNVTFETEVEGCGADKCRASDTLFFLCNLLIQKLNPQTMCTECHYPG